MQVKNNLVWKHFKVSKFWYFRRNFNQLIYSWDLSEITAELNEIDIVNNYSILQKLLMLEVQFIHGDDFDCTIGHE